MKDKLYTFEYVKVDRVVDGDTIHVTFDLGFNISHSTTIRFLDFDAPEIRLYSNVSEDQKERGLEITNWLKKRIEGKIVSVKTRKHSGDREKYGRYLGIIYLDGVNIIDEMIELGFEKTELEKAGK